MHERSFLDTIDFYQDAENLSEKIREARFSVDVKKNGIVLLPGSRK